MFTYEIRYLASPGAWHIVEDVYYCKAWTKWGAWRKWLEATKNYSHYSSYEYKHSYKCMRKDITNVSNKSIHK